MEVLNVTGITLVSAHKPCINSDRRTEPRKIFSFPSSTSSSKLSKFVADRPLLSGGLVLLSNILGGGLSKALTYEEALDQQSLSTAASGNPLDFDVGGLLDSIVSFGAENPPIIAGGVAALAIPLLLSQLLKEPKPWGVDSASKAYAKLSEDINAQLLDIRDKQEFKQVGSPDIRGLKKKPVSIVYQGIDKSGFLNKLSLKFKEPKKTTLFILDKFDGNSELVAELVTANGFKAAFAIKDGAEGPRGWKNSGLPWIPPKKTPSFDFDELTDVFASALGDGSDSLSVTLGIAAATGLGILAFTEIETILQVLGSAALVQFATKKLLFAEDRKNTLKEVDEFLTTNIAPAELLDEIKMIGKALLPAPLDGKTLLPTTEKGNPSTNSASPTVKVDEVQAVNTEKKTESSTAKINSVPKAEVEEKTVYGLKRPLSPYPYYPDFKPPTSPSPSQP